MSLSASLKEQVKAGRDRKGRMQKFQSKSIKALAITANYDKAEISRRQIIKSRQKNRKSKSNKVETVFRKRVAPAKL